MNTPNYYENTPIQKKIGCENENFHWKNFDIFLIFALNIDCGYTLEPPRRGGSNEYPQSMFGAKIRKIDLPLQTPVLLYKSGVQGVFIARTCFSDDETPVNGYTIRSNDLVMVWMQSMTQVYHSFSDTLRKHARVIYRGYLLF